MTTARHCFYPLFPVSVFPCRRVPRRSRASSACLSPFLRQTRHTVTNESCAPQNHVFPLLLVQKYSFIIFAAYTKSLLRVCVHNQDSFHRGRLLFWRGCVLWLCAGPPSPKSENPSDAFLTFLCRLNSVDDASIWFSINKYRKIAVKTEKGRIRSTGSEFHDSHPADPEGMGGGRRAID